MTIRHPDSILCNRVISWICRASSSATIYVYPIQPKTARQLSQLTLRCVPQPILGSLLSLLFPALSEKYGQFTASILIIFTASLALVLADGTKECTILMYNYCDVHDAYICNLSTKWSSHLRAFTTLQWWLGMSSAPFYLECTRPGGQRDTSRDCQEIIHLR